MVANDGLNVLNLRTTYLFLLLSFARPPNFHVNGITTNTSKDAETIVTNFLHSSSTSSSDLANDTQIDRAQSFPQINLQQLEEGPRTANDSETAEQRDVEVVANESQNDVMAANIDLSLNSPDQSIATEYNYNNNCNNSDREVYLTILLAKQEAKCLEDFKASLDVPGECLNGRLLGRLFPLTSRGSRGQTGGIQAKIDFSLPDDLYVPFLCPKMSHVQCEQCRSFTKKLFTPDDCDSFCMQDLWNCESRCKFIISSVMDGLNEYNSKQSNCDKGVCGFSSDSINNSSSDDSSLKTRVRSSGGGSVNRTDVTQFRDESLIIEDVDVFCEGVSGEPPPNHPPHRFSQNGIKATSGSETNYRRHFVLLKTLMNETATMGKPIVFVVEQRETDDKGEWTGFTPLGKTVLGFNEIKVAYFSKTYQFRVTAVNSNGIMAKKLTPPFKTLNGYVEPGEPKRIYVGTHRIISDSLDILICWEPPEERACFYKIVLENQDSEEKPRTIRIKDQPLGVNHYWFENLQFGSRYGVRVTSRTASWKQEDESTHAKLYFVTPSCLEAYHYQFSKCAPPPPRNLTSILTLMTPHSSSSSSSITTTTIKDEVSKNNSSSSKLFFSVQLAWLPPLYTSGSNVITQYIVQVVPSSLNLFHRHSYVVQHHDEHKIIPPSNISSSSSSSSHPEHLLEDSLSLGPFHLTGNISELRVDGLAEDTSYDILVSALSTKGPSIPARLTLSTKIAGEALIDSQHGNWIYMTILLACAIVSASSCHLLRLWIHKRKVKIARNLYFKAMEERDDLDNEWSIVPLNEEYSPWKMLRENMPKEKWDVGCGNLTLGEVIGSGAFGIVRRAEMPRKKYLEFQHRHKTPLRVTTVLDEDDDGATETVAVKMLKVSATTSDRDALIKEIVTMQNLGWHGQIVTHLGACTIGNSLCLVLEYCPGGDLLTFLRKVRQKYWPLLNIDESKSGKSTRSMSSSGGPTTSSQISYADLDGELFENLDRPDDFPSAERYSESVRSIKSDGNGDVDSKEDSFRNQDTVTSDLSTDVGSCDMCRPIDEKDILSYARQIALGMAYLEKNRVVHRDLACRNVLVMGDYKQVKLSDFGLSRDIYTSKVYHQKTNGKLPIKWMAIESIFSYCFTSKSDVWGYGIILWELVTLGGNPYPAIGNSELFHLLKSGYRMERPENCSEELYALMRKCWRSSPTDRPNFTELRHHLEMMLEAIEPTMYLSLRTDIPMDYSLNSRLDLPEVAYELPSRSRQKVKVDDVPHYQNDFLDVPMYRDSLPEERIALHRKDQLEQKLNWIKSQITNKNVQQPKIHTLTQHTTQRNLNNDAQFWRQSGKHGIDSSKDSLPYFVMERRNNINNFIRPTRPDDDDNGNNVIKMERAKRKMIVENDLYLNSLKPGAVEEKKQKRKQQQSGNYYVSKKNGTKGFSLGLPPPKPGFLFPFRGFMENRAYDLT